jgi:LPXTG cell wall anchor motif
MEMNTKELNGIRLGAALIGLICASTAGAQQQLDTGNLAKSRVQAATCTEVDWATDLLALYPRIGEACQEVVIAEGVKWARFDADFVRADNRDSTVTLNFKNRQGRAMGDLVLKPATAQRVLVDGRSMRFSQLTRGQQLNLYIPEGMFAVAIEPGAPPEQLAQIVRQPTSPAQANPAQLLAQNPTPRATTAQRLPATAGPLPFFAVAGLMSVLGGLGLTIRRRFLTRSR